MKNTNQKSSIYRTIAQKGIDRYVAAGMLLAVLAAVATQWVG